MRPSKGELQLAASSVRIARRRMREYLESDELVYDIDHHLLRWDVLLRRAEELLGQTDPDEALS